MINAEFGFSLLVIAASYFQPDSFYWSDKYYIEIDGGK